MHVAPPPSPGSRIQELGDTLVVRFRPRRSWGEIVFLGFWLALWTFGGIAAVYGLAGAGRGGRAFLVLWLCVWAVGEAFAAKEIAWQLAGREFLLVSANQLELRREIGRLKRSRRMHLLAVEAVHAQRVPASEDEKPREDYRLEVVSRDETFQVGDGMDEREAEHVASVVMSHIRPRPRWRDDEAESGSPRPAEDQQPKEVPIPRAFDRRWVLPRILPALIGATIIGALALTALPPLRHPPDLPRIAPPPAPPVEPRAARSSAERAAAGPPVRSDYVDPREYAAATTRYALSSARNVLHAAPTCGAEVTWTSWSCRAPATSKDGPFAGRRLLYRCRLAYQPQPFAAPVRTIECGPENPPPIAP